MSTQNPIIVENQNLGTTNWFLENPARNLEIAGYASDTSINRGSSIKIFVHCIEPKFSYEVYRMGWYNGAGARLMKKAVTVTGIAQAMPTPNPLTGLVECKWTNPITLKTTASSTTAWTSGYYLVKLTSKPSGFQSYIVFVVREDARATDLLFQQSVTNYAAYNMWGGKNLYGGEGGRASKVSFNRPYDEGEGSGQVWSQELQMIRFLEREGFDVKYATNIDTHLVTPDNWKAKAFLSVGHDEYWSWEMRSNVEQARELGINIAFFSANTCYRQIRLEPSPLTKAANRTIVCFKDNTVDPMAKSTTQKHLATSYWREAPTSRPEDMLMGVQYDEQCFPSSGDIVVSNATHWAFQNTNLQNGAHFINLMNGRETDRVHDNAPPTLEILCISPISIPDHPERTNLVAHTTMYTWPASGSFVFACGTLTWSFALDDFGQSWRDEVPVDPAVQQMTRNILNRFSGRAL